MTKKSCRDKNGNFIPIPQCTHHKKSRLSLLLFENHLGVFDEKNKKRLKDLCPKKSANIRVKASAFEGGYNTISSYDLHKQMRGRRTISREEYNKLSKKFTCK